MTPSLPLAGAMLEFGDLPSALAADFAAGLADFFPVAIVWLLPQFDLRDVCKLDMFSHRGQLWQTGEAEREESGLNCARRTLIGD
jgi:hypothetical protein